MIQHFFFSGCLWGFLFCTVNAPLHDKKNPDYLLPTLVTEFVSVGNQAISGHNFEWQDVAADNLGMGSSLLTLKLTF